MVTPVGSSTRCAVLHAPGYVSGECAGEIRLYRSTQSTGVWWLCDADAESAPSRGVHVVPADDEAA
jgi:hypothetical protein